MTRVQSEMLASLGLLEAAISSAMAGRLPPFLVNATIVREGLDDIATHLERDHRKTTILHRDIAFYYEQGQIVVTRIERNHTAGPAYIVIVLGVPLTVVPRPLRLYEVIGIPLAFPGNNVHTVIAGLPQAVMYAHRAEYYAVFPTLASAPTDNSLRLGAGSELLQRTRQSSCIISLLEGNLAEIDKLCEYRAIVDYPRIAIRLSNTQIFLSGYNSVTVMCDGTDELTEVRVTEPQIIFDINCQCSLIANDFILPSLTIECPSNRSDSQDKITTLYATNLPVIRKYFSEMQLIGIQTHTLLHNKLDVSLPDLKIAQTKLNASIKLNLAVQNRAEFSLDNIINSSLQDARSYSNLAQWLLEQSESITDHEKQTVQTESPFDPTSVWDWINLITTIIGVCGFGLAIWSLLRLRALTIMLVMRETHAYSITVPTRLVFQTSTKPTETSLVKNTVDQTAAVLAAIQTYIPLELTVSLVIVICLVVATVYFIYQYVHKSQQPTLTLIVGNQDDTLKFPIVRIVHGVNKDLVLAITSASSSMTVSKDMSSCLFVRGKICLD